jgi:hypothetical protein
MAKRSSGMTYIPETVNGSFDFKRNIRGSVSIKREVRSPEKSTYHGMDKSSPEARG